jgi:hypothetical protein
MEQFEIRLPKNAKGPGVRRAIEQACAAAGLWATMKTTLRTFPGCTHWHFKNGNEPGMLEVTYWPAAGRAWLSVQAGRKAQWIEKAIRSIQAKFRREIAR